MTSQGPMFFTVTILLLLTVFGIFAMKYFFAGRSAQAAAEREAELKALANRTAETESELLVQLKELKATAGELNNRVTAIESMLREVG